MCNFPESGVYDPSISGWQRSCWKTHHVQRVSCRQHRTIHPSALNTIAVLADALMNNATKKQSEVLFYKLLSVKEENIAEKLGISQPGVNSHSSSAKLYCIEEALNYFEQIKFENYE